MKELCKSLLEDKNAVILDTETTGLDNDAEILEISVIDMQGNVLFDSLIRPSAAKAWPDAQRVHKISPEAVSGFGNMNVFFDAFLKPLLSKKTIVVYNAPFDSRLLQQSLKASGIDYDVMSWEWVDVMEPYAEHWGDWSEWHQSYKWQRLTSACYQQGITVKEAHRALGDCRMTLDLLRNIASGE